MTFCIGERIMSDKTGRPCAVGETGVRRAFLGLRITIATLFWDEERRTRMSIARYV